MLFNFLRPKAAKVVTTTIKNPPLWRVEFTSNGVLIHGSRVHADTKDHAIHCAIARATSELAMRGSSLKYERIVASLAGA